MKNRQLQSGFTLVEMLTVVAIITLLSALLIGIAGRIDDQAKERTLKSTFALLEAALQEYREFKGDFPGPPPFLTAPAARSEYLYSELHVIPGSRKILETVSDSLIKNRFGTVDSPLEIYDPWGTALDYRYEPGRDTFPLLQSAGPDRKYDTPDDIANR